jgi:hypothetical protein
MMKVGGEFIGKWVHDGDGQSQNGGSVLDSDYGRGYGVYTVARW